MGTQNSSEMAAPHPLKHKWTFHGHTVDKSKGFEANQLELASFDTVEDFWSAWYSCAKPSQLFATRDWRKEPVRTAPVSAICLFKHGIEPKWEDPANMNGGQWFCQVRPRLAPASPPPLLLRARALLGGLAVVTGRICCSRGARA